MTFVTIVPNTNLEEEKHRKTVPKFGQTTQMFLQDGKMITKEGSSRIESFQIIGTEINL